MLQYIANTFLTFEERTTCPLKVIAGLIVSFIQKLYSTAFSISATDTGTGCSPICRPCPKGQVEFYLGKCCECVDPCALIPCAYPYCPIGEVVVPEGQCCPVCTGARLPPQPIPDPYNM